MSNLSFVENLKSYLLIIIELGIETYKNERGLNIVHRCRAVQWMLGGTLFGKIFWYKAQNL